jgi:2,3-dihydroxybenzoate decarboxylase
MISNKIALEEHFAIEETLGDSQQFMPGDFWTELKGRLLDKPEQRLRRMDKAGIELSLYSLNAPAIQALQDPGQALEIARRANDALAAEVARHPGRLAGLAALPMQDPEAAAAELRRCVRELGFRGALVNGFSDTPDGLGCLYYDLPRYDGFWGEVAALDVPFYLHPREPLESQRMIYEGHPWLMGPVWAFGQETAVHALRLMTSGLFDRHPGLTVILGHLGEGLPFSLWRAEHRIRKFSRGCPALRPLGEYFRNNFYITTSGNCRTQALLTTLLEVGADRILFSTDYPFEEMQEPAEWFETLPIAETDKLKIARTNSARLFKLDRA